MLHWLNGRRWASLALVISLVACGGGGGGGSSSGSGTTGTAGSPVETPVARISASGVNTDSTGAARAMVNGQVSLDASSSTAPSSGIQSYAWKLTQVPPGSQASLSSADQALVSFTPDKAGTYQVALTLTGKSGISSSKTMELQVAEAPPVANILVSAVYTGSSAPAQMAPIDATLGSIFTLDSSQVKASDGSAVTSSWSVQLQPPGSSAKIQASGSRFQFTPDLLGDYVLKARVTDSRGIYSDALYTLRVIYTPPSTTTMIVAPNFSAGRVEQSPVDTTLGTNFLLDTSALLASDGSAVRTTWTVLQRPDGSQAPLVGNDPRVQFRPDQLGLYKLLAHVEDQRGAYSETVLPINVRYMAPSTTNILVDRSFTGTTVEQAPISASLGSVFTLDTSAIRSSDGTPLTSSWQILAQPGSSRAQLSGSGSRYQFTPDVLGTYRLKVRVQDVRGAWGESIYTLSVLNTPPEARASVNASPVAAISYGSARVQAGATVTLRGGASYDADGDTLSYRWSLVNAPGGSSAALSSTSASDTVITFDKDGDYTIALRVTDPQGAYSDRQITIGVGDAPPVIVYDHSSWTALTGSTATASAEYSYSPQGRSLTYAWTLDSRPAGSAATIANGSSSRLSFTPDVAGTYVASVIVSDGTLRSSASFTLRALAAVGQTTEIGFNPVDVRYSKGLDLLVTTSASPNLLSFIDPFSGQIRSVPLLAAPKGLRLSPNGKLALVLYGSIIDLFDVQTGNRIHTSNVLSIRSEALLLDTGEAILYGGDQWSGVPGMVNARTGDALTLSVAYAAGTFWGSQQYAVYADKLSTAFSVSGGLSPSKLTYLKLDPRNPSSVQSSGDWPYHGDYYAYMPIALNAQQSLVFDRNGIVARTSDLKFAGRIDLGGSLINVSASSDDSELLALGWNGSLLSSSYTLLDPSLLLARNTLSLPTIGGQQSYGLALFHSAADRHVGVVQTGGSDTSTSGKRYWVFAR